MKQFLKLTWTSLVLKENRKRNCLKCQFCLFFVSVNVKQGSRPILSIPSKLNRFRYGIHFSISAGVTSSTHHVNRKILVAHDRNFIHKSLKYFFTLKNQRGCINRAIALARSIHQGLGVLNKIFTPYYTMSCRNATFSVIPIVTSI